MTTVNIKLDGFDFLTRRMRLTGISIIIFFLLSFLPPSNAQAATNRWDFTSSTEGWTVRNANTNTRHSNDCDNDACGRLYIDTYGDDPGIVSPDLSLSAAGHGKLKMKIATYCDDKKVEAWFKNSSSGTLHEGGFLYIDNKGQWETKELDLSSNQEWTGTITQIRIDPTSNCGSPSDSGFLAFDYIEVAERPQNPPIVSLALDQNEISHGWSVRATVASHDPDGDGYSCKWKVNAGSWNSAPSNGSFDITAENFVIGENEIFTRCTDSYGLYGETSKTVTDYAVPNAAPGNLSPANVTELEIRSSYEFRFSGVANAHHYQVMIADNSALSSPIYDQEVAGSPFYVGNNIFEPGKTYYWKICGENILQTKGPWTSESFKIKSEHILPPPAPISPQSDAQFHPGDVIEFKWSNNDIAPQGNWLKIVSMPSKAEIKSWQFTGGATDHPWAVFSDLPAGNYAWELAIQIDGKWSGWASRPFIIKELAESETAFFTPLYRLYKYDANNNTRDHLYTTLEQEKNNAVDIGYSDEGIECYISNRNFYGGIPLLRLYRADHNSHFYTTSQDEMDYAILQLNYKFEGPQGYVYKNYADGMTSLHCLRQESGTPLHYFLCTRKFEYDHAKANGYTEANINGIGFVSPGGVKDPIAHTRPQGNYGGVDLGSGALRGLNSVDLAMNGRGPSLVFAHYYNSFNFNRHPMGPGWSHNLNVYIEESPNGNVNVNWGNGTVSPFEKEGDTYKDKSGNHDQLTLIATNEYQLKKKDQTILKFEKKNVQPPPGIEPGDPFYTKVRIVLTRVADWSGNALNFEYDSVYGRLTSVSDGFGRKLVLAYNDSHQLESVKEVVSGTDKRSVSFSYDSDGKLAQFMDVRQKMTRYNYHADELLESVTYPRGNTAINFTYDDAMRVDSIKVGGNPASMISYPTANTSEVYDPKGNIYTYTHSDLRLTERTGPDANTSYFQYADANNPNSPTRVVDKEGNAASFEYDAMGNVKKIANAEGNFAEFTYNDKNNVLTFKAFHAPDETVTPTTFNYDVDTGLKLISVVNPENETMTFAYNANNQLQSVKDGRNNPTTFTYDAYGNLETTTDAEGNATRFVNDYAGRTVQVTDGENKNVWHTYDDTDNLVAVKNHIQHVVEMIHNDNGLLDAITWLNDGVRSSTTYAYDDEDRLKSVTNPLGLSSAYSYNESGLLKTSEDYMGNVVSYTYDLNSRLKEMVYPDGGKIAVTGRNKNGAVTSLEGASGSSAFEYNQLNKVKTYTDPYGKVVRYEYNTAGQLSKLIYPDGKAVLYTYDKAGRLKTVVDWLGNLTEYLYDAAGNLKEIHRQNGTKAFYGYDRANRLTSIREEKSDGSVICSYSYTLDGVGNYTGITAQEPLDGFVSAKDVSYTYDKASNRLLSAGSITYTYDDNGNRKTKTDGGATTTYHWNYDNMLIKVVMPDKTIEYVYDAMNNRIAKTVDGVTTRYVLNLAGSMSTVLAETDGLGNITAYYVYGLGLISRIEGDVTHFYHFNHRGDTIALTSRNGVIIDQYAYDEYGNLLDSVGNTGNPFKYVGAFGVMDEYGNIYFMRNRLYDSSAGFFLSEDPLGFSGGYINLNLYAGANPVMGIDPNGKFCGTGACIAAASIVFRTIALKALELYTINTSVRVVTNFAIKGANNTIVRGGGSNLQIGKILWEDRQKLKDSLMWAITPLQEADSADDSELKFDRNIAYNSTLGDNTNNLISKTRKETEILFINNGTVTYFGNRGYFISPNGNVTVNY